MASETIDSAVGLRVRGDTGRTRTRVDPGRSRMPYPLGHGVPKVVEPEGFEPPLDGSLVHCLCQVGLRLRTKWRRAKGSNLRAALSDDRPVSNRVVLPIHAALRRWRRVQVSILRRLFRGRSGFQPDAFANSANPP